MMVKLLLADDGQRILGWQHNIEVGDGIVVPSPPPEPPNDYRYVDGEYIHDPVPVPPDEPDTTPTPDELSEAISEVAGMAADNEISIADLQDAVLELAGLIGGMVNG